jgi:hypothetical protein
MDQALHHQQQLEQQEYEERDAPLPIAEYRSKYQSLAAKALGVAQALKDLRDANYHGPAVLVEERLIELATEFENLKRRGHD